MRQGAARYFFKGDTTLNGIQYKIVRGYPIVQANPGPFCPPFLIDTTASFLAALMREDTVTGKVYKRDHTSWPQQLMDELLYDFSLSVGDTLHSAYMGMGATLVVDSIRLVTLEDGVSRRIFYFNPTGFPPGTYTEGLGSSTSLFDPMMPGIGFGYGIECITENNLPITGINCYPILDAHDKENPDLKISLFPNPTSNYITINLETNLPAIISFFDATGNRMFTQMITNSSETISLGHLPNALYFYVIEQPGKTTKSGKISLIK